MELLHYSVQFALQVQFQFISRIPGEAQGFNSGGFLMPAGSSWQVEVAQAQLICKSILGKDEQGPRNLYIDGCVCFSLIVPYL